MSPRSICMMLFATAWACSPGGGAPDGGGGDASLDACALGCIDGQAASGPSGAIDPTFGGDKPLLPTLSGLLLRRIVTLPSGDSAIFGSYPSAGHLILVRFHPDGTIASSLTPMFDSTTLGLSDATMQPDGSALFAYSSASGCVVQRFTPTGNPDNSYGTGSKTTIGDSTCAAPELVLAFDGTLRVATSSTSSNGGLVFWKLTASGAVDSTFGSAGTVSYSSFRVSQVVPSASGDGSSFAAGLDAANGALVMHFGADGAEDTLFGTGGTASVPVPAGNSSISVVLAVGSNGMIVAATGHETQGGATAMDVALLSATGAPITTFGQGGVVSSLSAPALPFSAAVRADATVLVGTAPTQSVASDVFTEFGPAGAPNTAFTTGLAADGGLDGILGPTDTVFDVLAFESDGKIIAAGETSFSGPTNRLFLTRLFP